MSWPEGTVEDGVLHRRDIRCHGQALSMSDDRLSGIVDTDWNEDTYPVPGATSVVVKVGTHHISNKGGTWACQFTEVHPAGDQIGSNAATLECVGDGGCAGLSAHLVIDATATPMAVIGEFIPGELPTAP